MKKKESEKGIIKIALAIIGFVVVLSLLGVKLAVIEDIGLQIWERVVLPAFENIRSMWNQ